MSFKLEYNVDYLITEQQINGKYYYYLDKYENDNIVHCLTTSYDNDNNRIYPVNIYNLTDNEVIYFFDLFFTKTFSYYWWYGNRQYINSELQRIFSDNDCYISYNINGIKVNNYDTQRNYSTIQTFINYDLYSRPLDNSNVFQTLNGLLQTPNPQLSDDDYKLFRAVEAYNSNFFKSRNFNYDVSVSSGSSSSVDLSTINTQLTNIANNLKTTVHDDDSGQDIEVSVTEIIKDKEDTVNVLNQIQEVETKNKERELMPFLNNDEWSF